MLLPEEREILQQLNFEESDKLLHRFSELYRHSGSEEEKTAAYYISERLRSFGVDHEILWPELYLSNPVKAEIKIIGKEMDIKVKTPAFSMSTGEKWIDGEMVFAASVPTPYALDSFEYNLNFEQNPKGKIVVCEGVPSPVKVNDIIVQGGVAAIFVQPGKDIHQCTCTSIWGSPGLEDFNNNIRIPVVSINSQQGKKLIHMLKKEKLRAAIKTSLVEGWKKCPLVLAKIGGKVDTDKFILLHGHIDSWYAGIGDNALGDAALLEIARVLKQNEGYMKRKVWIAWWPGHSNGRFAGSTWFADNYAMELYRNCVCQINCESPGCRDADTYENIMWTEDVDDFCRSLVEEVTGITPKWARPLRAGDYSFNNIGITSMFMRSSAIGEDKIKDLGYYEVYGSGGNIEWHTEKDDMRVVDEKNFMRDIKLYLAALLKLCHSPILPIDIRTMLQSMEKYVRQYEDFSQGLFNFSPVFEGIRSLSEALENFYKSADEIKSCKEKAEVINNAIIKVQRKLIRINYTKREEFNHDQSVLMPPVPLLADILKIKSLNAEERKFLVTGLVRARNRVVYSLLECEEYLKDITF